MATTPNFTDPTWQLFATAHVEGTPNGDILWRNILNNQLVLWEMDGASITTTNDLTVLQPPYEPNVVGDFDGDGKADIWLRHVTTGDNRIMLSDTGISNVFALNTNWDVRAATELTGDGKDDVVIFNKVNTNLAAWEMDGASPAGLGGVFPSAYTTDDVLHSAFNGTSGNTFDSLWFDDSANQYDITSYDTGVRTVTGSFNVQPGNDYVNSADYNGDGNTDFLFRDADGSDTGSIEIVYTNNFNEIARLTYEVPTFQGVTFETGGDFDGDGIAEVIMRDSVGGGTSIYNTVGGTTSNQTLVGSDGNDLIDGKDGNDNIYAGDGDDIIIDSGTSANNADHIFGGAGDDLIDGGIEGDRIWGESGNDLLQGQSGDDFLSGGDGNDTLYAGNGTDMLFGDAGDDYLVGGSFGFDHMKGGAGNDVLRGTGDYTLMEGGSGDDQLLGGSSLDYLFGDSGDDYLVGGLSQDTLNGGSGNDILIGVDVAGTSGTDDYLTGGSGNDFFYLGSDNTNYYVGSGRAFITDFSSSSDYIMLNGSSSNYSFVDTGSNIEIRQASDADVIAVVENVASAAQVSSRVLYIG